MRPHRVVALVSDLMDRSRLSVVVPGIELASDPDGIAGADVVVVDLNRYGAALADVRRRVPGAFLVAYGPHVDDAALMAARADGADRVLPRSRFFKDAAAALSRDEQPPDQ
jgi:hypothetical protein